MPAELEAICLKCLDKSTGERYATAAELADDLSRFLEGKPVRARRVGRVSRMTKAVRSLQRSTLILISLVLSGWLLVLAALGMYVRSFNESPGGRIGLKSTDPEAELISDLRGAFNSWYENARTCGRTPTPLMRWWGRFRVTFPRRDKSIAGGSRGITSGGCAIRRRPSGL